jgi:hypothetical protein
MSFSCIATTFDRFELQEGELVALITAVDDGVERKARASGSSRMTSRKVALPATTRNATRCSPCGIMLRRARRRLKNPSQSELQRSLHLKHPERSLCRPSTRQANTHSWPSPPILPFSSVVVVGGSHAAAPAFSVQLSCILRPVWSVTQPLRKWCSDMLRIDCKARRSGGRSGIFSHRPLQFRPAFSGAVASTV